MSLLDKLERFQPETKRKFLVKVNVRNIVKKSHIKEESILERIKPLSKVEFQILQKSPIVSEREIKEVPISFSEKEKEDYEIFSKRVFEKEIESRRRKHHELDEEDKELVDTIEENIDVFEEEREKENEEREEEEKIKIKQGEEEEEEEEEGEGEGEKEKEGEGEGEKEGEKPKKASKTRKTRGKKGESEEEENVTDFLSVKIGKTIVADRIRAPEKIIMKASPYYMNNRKLFIQKLATILTPYRERVQSAESEISCDNIRKEGVDLDLLTHQEIVREYLNLYTT